jgi:transposase
MSIPSNRNRSQAHQPPLFEFPADSPAETQPATEIRGRPRLRRANREQIVFHAAPLDALISHDPPARLVWASVEGLDLTPLDDRIKAVQRGPGRAPIDPKILRALWLSATIPGMGSARHRDELCREPVAFPWLAGDGSPNYHTLADFRTDHVELLEDLLTQGLATLMAEGLVELNRVAQDGRRIRASAGAASFRRRLTREEALAAAQQQVEALREEVEEDPAATDRRPKAARERVARERVEGIPRAWERLPELEAQKKPPEKDQARGSTTAAEATVMKMADGGFRPASNFQFATDTASPVIVGVGVETTGRDAGQMVPLVDQVEDRTGKIPPAWLVDGGLAQHDPIDAVSAPGLGSTVSAPGPKPQAPKGNRFEPKPSDRAAVAGGRERMATDQAKTISQDRAATAEGLNAVARGRGLIRLLVRGLAKVKAMALWYALAHHLRRAAQLRAAAAGQG